MKDVIEQARGYQKDARESGRGQYKAGDIAAERHVLLGIPVVITTTIVGTSIFASLSADPAIGWKILVGLISIVAAILSALQTFFNYSEIAEKHRVAGARYGKKRRRFEAFLLRYGDGDSRDAALTDMEKLSDELSKLAEESPRIPDRAWKRALNEMEKKARAAGKAAVKEPVSSPAT